MFLKFVKISLHTPFCGGCGKYSLEKIRKKMDFGTFWCIFQYYFVLKMFIAYHEIMIVQPGG